ncbi:hypothetical protein Pelo_10492 [Pelomyxa schiedti]|nr:hypothetical protein Pelo_10492 [Pelomyxa schiedti]
MDSETNVVAALVRLVPFLLSCTISELVMFARSFLVDCSWCHIKADHILAIFNAAFGRPRHAGTVVRIYSIDRSKTTTQLFFMAVEICDGGRNGVVEFIRELGPGDVLVSWTKTAAAAQAVLQFNEAGIICCQRYSVILSTPHPSVLEDETKIREYETLMAMDEPAHDLPYKEYLFQNGLSTEPENPITLHTRWWLFTKFHCAITPATYITFTYNTMTKKYDFCPPRPSQARLGLLFSTVQQITTQYTHSGIKKLRKCASLHACVTAIEANKELLQQYYEAPDGDNICVTFPDSELQQLKEWVQKNYPTCYCKSYSETYLLCILTAIFKKKNGNNQVMLTHEQLQKIGVAKL